MRNFFISTAIAVLLFGSFSCKETTEEKSLTKEISFTKDAELRLIKANNDSIIVNLDIEIADTDYKTETGLMYRNYMDENQAMLFVFDDERPRSFYMKNTAIALDIIYLNTNKEIVSIQKNAKPYDQTSLPSNANAKYVLEVNAGLSEKWQLENGDKIDWTKL